ncbi:unnamed protein product [Mesocestoides corti]|uniref:Cilia- and flagella-associated protein 251 n=1 Tax=Mesocestoides corti TaxID=53468 RepID=A0A158QSI7_MESCO|nr:unnamed protein product [Mesocestoides corti]
MASNSNEGKFFAEDTNYALYFPIRIKSSWGPENTDTHDPLKCDRRTLPRPTPYGAEGGADGQPTKIPSSVGLREALKPIRVFSFNQNVPIINLSDGDSFRVFFVSGHLAVIYDVNTNEQHILRGHVNTIVCTCASRNRRWLGSGDCGPDSAVIVWDARKHVAVRTMLDIHTRGVFAMQLTPDARYLATLNADDGNQLFAVWNWSISTDEPLCYTQLPDNIGTQRKIAFKQDDYFQVMSNSETHVVFYHWKIEGCMTSHSPTLSSETFRKNYGKFVMSEYIPGTNMAITATTLGFVVVWGTSRRLQTQANVGSCFKVAIKLVPIHPVGITYLTITSCVSSKLAIVTGDERGQIRFSDMNFKLLKWHNDTRYGPISSISFVQKEPSNSCLEEFNARRHSDDKDDSEPSFVTEDFIVCTTRAIILVIRVEKKTIKLLEREQCATVNAVAVHPLRHLVTTVGYSGMVKTWNYRWLVPVRTRVFDNEHLNACAYDPSGSYLAIGFTSGRVMFLDAITLNDASRRPFDYAKGVIKKIAFSPDGQYCAYVDSHFSTTMLRMVKLCDTNKYKWVFAGRYCAHGDEIVDIMFKATSNPELPRLLTLGEDRMVVEYDVQNAKHTVLPLKRRIQVEQFAKPQCFTSLGDFYSEDFICVANSYSKFRLLSADKLAIRKTVMAPIKGATFVNLAPLPEKDDFPTPPGTPLYCGNPENKNCLVYLTNEQLGLVLVPLDGDPYKAVSVIAHPSGDHGTGFANGLAVSPNKRFVFTTGGSDNSMIMWKADPGALVAQTRLYADPMQPFLDMLSPDQVNDMKDYFYLSMLRVQGLTSMETRLTSYTVPITELPYLMRALGLHISDFDIENMLNEIKYSSFASTGHYVTDIDFDTFVKLMLNHRAPYKEIALSDIQTAFEAIKKAEKPHQLDCPERGLCSEQPELALHRTSLFRLLQTIGEPIRHNELVETLAVLFGLAPESGRVENDCTMRELKVTREIEERLPSCITPKDFYTTVLAVDVCNKQPPAASDAQPREAVNANQSAAACQIDS